VILLHGMLGSSDNWHPIVLTLAEKFHVFAVDQRNHGRSPHDDEMNYPRMAADLDKFMILRGLASAVVIGHSMGGKTAMQFALEFPGRVEKLVVADMSPRAYAPAHDRIFAALLGLDLSTLRSRQQAEAALAPDIPDLALRRFLLKNLGRDAGGRFLWKINLRSVVKNYRHLRAPIERPDPFTKPAMFIRGGKSDYLNPQDEPLIRELFPQAKIQTIPSARHWVHADQPEEFMRLVLSFLE